MKHIYFILILQVLELRPRQDKCFLQGPEGNLPLSQEIHVFEVSAECVNHQELFFIISQVVFCSYNYYFFGFLEKRHVKQPKSLKNVGICQPRTLLSLCPIWKKNNTKACCPWTVISEFVLSDFVFVFWFALQRDSCSWTEGALCELTGLLYNMGFELVNFTAKIKVFLKIWSKKYSIRT